MSDDDRDSGQDDPGNRAGFGTGTVGGRHPQPRQGSVVTTLVVVLTARLKTGSRRRTLMDVVSRRPVDAAEAHRTGARR